MSDSIRAIDGIEQNDGNVPAWLVWFLGVVAFVALGYWLYFEAFGIGQSQLETFKAEQLAALDTGEPVTEEDLAAMVADSISVADGAKIYARSCVRCHGAKGGGKIGPNLTDAYWIGGGSAVDIYNTIYRGRAGRGMQAWGPTYGRGGVMQVAAFVITLRNTNVPGEPPEGEKWEEPTAPAPDPSEPDR